MKTNLTFKLFCACFLPAALCLRAVAQLTMVGYQGQLYDGGVLASANYDLTFTFYNVLTGGAPLAPPATVNPVAVNNGLFTVHFGASPSLFNLGVGGARFVEIAARPSGSTGNYTVLAPRQLLTQTPYAILAQTADGVQANSVTAAGIAPNQVVKSLNGLQDSVVLAAGSNLGLITNGNTLTLFGTGGGGGVSNAWLLTGNAGTTPGLNYVGTPDNQPLELHVHGQRALLLQPDNTGSGSPNIIGGSPNNSVSAAIGATIGGGGGSATSSANSVSSGYGTVAGGLGNTASGGLAGTATANTVSGGGNNTASGGFATVGGGFGNGASGYEAAVGGGVNNHATASSATVSGGNFNTASANGAFVGGGGFDGNATAGNQAAGNVSVVGGGIANLAGADYAVVSGGQNNSASGQSSFVGGGQSNNAAGFFSTVGGGQTNSAAGQNSVVGGGLNNNAGISLSVIGGGLRNTVFNRIGGTIGGGGLNLVAGLYATVPGGYQNSAGGTESFAAGAYADALHDNSFVWSDGSRQLYESAGANTFNVLASGGVYFELGSGTPVTTHGSGFTESAIWSSNERAILSLHSTITPLGQLPVERVWTLESGLYGTPGLFGIYDRTAGTDRMTIDTAGFAYFNGPKVSVCTLEIRGGCDLAEPFEISEPREKDIPQGSVVVIDEQNPGRLKLSDQPYDTRVAGVVSGANGVSPGIQMHQQGLLEGGRNVALTGRVYVLADASAGAIRPGDLLTTSSVPGHAMRVRDNRPAQGAILGKAMTGLTSGQGMVLALVTLQ
jgi:hypothetical protein